MANLSEAELKNLRPLDVATLACQLAVQAGGTGDVTTYIDPAIALVGLARQGINNAIKIVRSGTLGEFHHE